VLAPQRTVEMRDQIQRRTFVHPDPVFPWRWLNLSVQDSDVVDVAVLKAGM